MHLTADLIRALAAGRLRPQVFVQLFEHHLRELCPTCRAELEAFAARQAQAPEARLRSLSVLASLGSAAEAADTEAGDLLADLRGAVPEERLKRLRREPERFLAAPVLDALLATARDCLPADGEGSLAWSELALADLDLHPSPDPVHLVLATAHQANGWRIAGNLRAAARGLAEARRILLDRGVTDTDTCARLDSLQASLYIHLHRFDEAYELLSRAGTLYRLLQRRSDVGATLLQVANLHRYRDETGQASEITRQALDYLDPAYDTRLYLIARYELAHDFLASGDPEAARDLLAYDADLYERHADPRTQLHVTWLEGRIALAQEQLQDAEHAFLAVREGHTLLGNVYDVGAVSLDLAQLYYRQHRADDLARIAAEAITLFRASGVERDAMAALLLLQDALEAETLTAATLREAAQRLGASARRFPLP